METLKNLWMNPWVKTAVYGAGGATGGVMATGQLVINKQTVIASCIGAFLALWGLFTQHPTNPGPPAQ